MIDMYMHEEYKDKDVARNAAALDSARRRGLLNSYTGLELAANGGLAVVKRVVTRGPVAAAKGVWNLPDKDRRVLDRLVQTGWAVYLLLWDEASDTFSEVEYAEAVGSGVRRPGRGNQSDYTEVRA